MMENSNLIVMLTHNDYTVNNAREVFEDCKCSQTKLWGMKEHSLAFPEMKALFLDMKNLGMTTFLEVVGYTEKEGLAGVKMAVECNCDFLLGTTFCDSILELCKNNSIKYMPFIGNVHQRPSILEGNIESMINDANQYVKKGAYGIDLLGFRYVGNSSDLIKQVIDCVKAPVCLAGSIDDYNKLDFVKRTKPKFFTIGSAFFENKFGEAILSQINNVCDYVGKEK